MPTVKSLCELAREEIKQGRFEEAESIVSRVLTHYPKSVEAHRVLGEVYAESGRVEEAGRFFRLVLSADPEDYFAHVGLGVSLRDQGSLHDAIFEFERALELRPNNAELRKEILRLRALRDGVQGNRVKPTRATLARIYLADGRYERAREGFAAVVEKDVSRLDAWVGLLQALWRAGRSIETMEEGKRVLDLAPDCVKTQLILGACYLQEGHLEEAQHFLEKAHALDPDGILAEDLFEGELPRAFAELGPSEVPDEPEGHSSDLRLLGVSSPTLTIPSVGARRSAERPAVPSSERDTADLAPFPDNPPRLATARLRSIPGDTMRPPRRPIAADQEGDTTALNEPASEDISEMIAAVQRVLQDDPSNHLYRLHLATLLAASGQLDKALPEFRTLVEDAPELLEDLIDELQLAAAEHEQNAEIRRLLGDAYMKRGRFQEAIDAYGKVLDQK